MSLEEIELLANIVASVAALFFVFLVWWEMASFNRQVCANRRSIQYLRYSLEDLAVQCKNLRTRIEKLEEESHEKL